MFDQEQFSDLLKKYDVPTPRYTSYPTVPLWDVERFSITSWEEAVRRSFDESNATKGISIYIHLPFCESLCTYCACNTRITKNHKVEERYIESVLKEWNQYLRIFSAKPIVREIHLGGGTPTFFSPKNLSALLTGILENVDVHADYEFSFEGHPNNTTREHLEALYDLGFRRVSFGVQDLDEKVQRAIHRIQPLDNLQRVTALSREIGYTSVSYDLIYGLPHQTLESVSNTMANVLALRPDRISFYSYAHVPWIKPGQRGYEDADLPTDIAKRRLYETGRNLLRANGYEDVGMDHFSLTTDKLFKSKSSGFLNRNFMGYTTNNCELLIGLGTSAISDAKYAYAQNVKKVEEYHHCVEQGISPVHKGHVQTRTDLRIRKVILDIACQGIISQRSILQQDEETINTLATMIEEGILYANIDGLQITEMGRAFTRNVCALFDKRMLERNSSKSNTFSQSI